MDHDDDDDDDEHDDTHHHNFQARRNSFDPEALVDDLGPSADFMESLRDRVGMVMIIMMNIMAMVIINIMTMITMMIAGANIMEYLQDGVALMMLVVTMMVVV